MEVFYALVLCILFSIALIGSLSVLVILWHLPKLLSTPTRDCYE